MGKRRRRRGKKGKRRHLTEDGFITSGTNEVIQKLQAQQQDTQETLQLERDITAHPEVQAAESIVELFLSNVDDAATPEFALQQLRSYFTNAKRVGEPGNSDMQRLSLHGLAPDKAALTFRKLQTFLDRSTGKTRRRGCAIVEVPNDQVADFFCCASQHEQRGGGGRNRAAALQGGLFAAMSMGSKGINLAPPGRRVRYVNIRRNNRRRGSQGGSDATMQKLDVSRVSVLDIDFREVVEGGRAGGRYDQEYRARRLWESSVDEAGIDLKQRALKLKRQHSVSLSIDLRTIKHVKVLHPDGELPRGVDVSSCEAFASPTAYICLTFASTRGFDAGHKALKSFRINLHKHAITTRMHGSRHTGVCGGVSHRLPPTLAPLTSQDLSDVGDTAAEVAFLLDLLLRHGHLRAVDVPGVLGMLRCLCQWRTVESYTAYLNEAADNFPAFYRCNDGMKVFEAVSNMYSQGQHLRQEDSGSTWHGSAAFPHPSHAPAAAPELPGAGTRSGLREETSQMSSKTPSTDDEADDDAESDEEEDEEPGEEEEGIMWPRRVIVTPLRALPYPATPEVSNRIIRRFRKFEDRFLRVAFASEWLGSISYLDLSPAVCDRIRSLLRDGLTVGNRRFVFLAFSNSQLREHACWMYCEDGRAADGAPSADEIRRAVGELSALRTPAKYAARLGQGFSTTFETFRFDSGDICTIPDVTAADGELFSDGVGVITTAGMRKVANLLPMRMRRRLTGTLPSAIQIRLGGCKGMLALWDGIRGMRPGALVGVRPSMKKFESEDLAVEVCAVARPMPAAINRQLIMALLSLKINDSIFWKKYQAHVRQLDQLLTGGDEALVVLRAMGAYAAHSAQGVGVSQGSLPACMIEAGISPRDDVFLMSLCQAYRTFALKNVEDKCRMPLEDGVNLIGVMDESGTLPAGTFWARWDRNRGRRHPGNPTGDPEILPLPPGTRAAVSRFPCLSPADVRVLRAADPSTLSPALTALTNVVVFPRVGTPEPCKMSGGDLDGDIYLLTWDPELMPPREAVAVDYTPAKKPQDQLLPVTVSDIVDFFIDYMKNDQLGRIANGHLAIADFAVDEDEIRVYADNEKCHELVQLHSTAVDFAKTGVPVNPEDVSAVMRDQRVPDYLGGTDKSTTVIGKITRDAKERIAAGGEEVTWQSGGMKSVRWGRYADPDLLLAPWQLNEMMDDAEQLLNDWTWDICQIMRRFGATDVGQVFAGRVREFHGRAAGREKQADHQKQLDIALATLVEKCQRWWFPDVEPAEAASVLDSDVMSRTVAPGPKSAVSTLQAVEASTQQDMLRAASALYKAAYTPDPQKSLEEHLIRRACPWRVAPRLLLQLKLHNSAAQASAQR